MFNPVIFVFLFQEETVNGITTRLLLEQTHKYDRVKHVNGIITRLLLEQTNKYDRVKHVNGITTTGCDPINMFNPVIFVCLFHEETGCDPINMFNPVTFVCLFQEETGCDPWDHNPSLPGTDTQI
jgi:hypothetical protein